VNGEAAASDSVPDAADIRRPPGPAEGPAGADSSQGAPPSSRSTPAPSKTPQVAPETAALPAATDEPKTQG
jgi:hypothetical protein